MSKLFVDEIVHQSSQGSGTITIGASGETINVVGTLQNNGAGVGGTNTPAFLAYLGSTQTPTNDAYNIVQNDTEVFDTDSCYDTGTYKFTPTTSGKYFIYACTWMQSNSDEAKFQHTNIEKNGSTYLARTTIDFRNTAGRAISCFVSTVTEMNGTTDYLRVSTFPNFLNSNTTFVSGQQNTFFGGYKIIE